MTWYLRCDDGTKAVASSLGRAIAEATAMVRRGDVQVTLHGGSIGPALYRVYPQTTIRGDRIINVGEIK